MLAKITIPEAIDQVGRRLQNLYGSNPVPSAVIKRETAKLGQWPLFSIIPSDYCYNHTNKGARPTKDRIFLKEGRAYRYVGRNYPYSGYVTSNPRTPS